MTRVLGSIEIAHQELQNAFQLGALGLELHPKLE